MPPHVSVLCATFRPGGIDVLLTGMADQTFRDFEVVLVDRRYERRHAGVVELAADHGIDLLHVPEHRRNGKWAGIGAAWNTAMALADGAVLIFLPDWTYAPPGWIEAHLAWRALGDSTYVVSPYRHTHLPPLHLKQPFDFAGQYDHSRSCAEADAVLRGEVLDELTAFEHPITGSEILALPQYDTHHQDTRVAAPGSSLHPSWIHLKNESIGRALAYRVNGLDERLDRGKGPLDIDFALRVFAAGGQSVWAPGGMAYSPDPRWLCGSMPWGDKDRRVEGRWSYYDGDAYNRRRAQEAGRGDIRAKNPFVMEELRAKLLGAGWRDKARVIDTAPLDVDDLTYHGQEIWPETP